MNRRLEDMGTLNPLWKIFIPMTVFMLAVSLACTLIGGTFEQENIKRTQTALSQTSQAMDTAAAQPTLTQPPQATQPAEETQPPEQTLPPEETLPPEPEQPEETEPPPEESSEPTISARVNTNCREAPSQDFEIIGYLLKGQTSVVIGAEPSGNWWEIVNPDNPNETCWVWSQTTTVSGDTSDVPEKEPPPVPDALVGVSFAALNMCGPDPTLIFQVNNGSHVELESLGLLIEDITEGDTVFGPAQQNSPFLVSVSDCPPGASVLPAVSTAYVGGKVSRQSLPGAMMRAAVKLCSLDNLQGVCSEQSIQFLMPSP